METNAPGYRDKNICADKKEKPMRQLTNRIKPDTGDKKVSKIIYKISPDGIYISLCVTSRRLSFQGITDQPGIKVHLLSR